jgi:hypothetical protein
MAWSRGVLKATRGGAVQSSQKVPARRAISAAKPKPAARARAVKHVAPGTQETQSAKIADSQATNSTPAFAAPRTNVADTAPKAATPAEPPNDRPWANAADLPPVTSATPASPAPRDIPDTAPKLAAAEATKRTTQEQVMAALAVAEQITAAAPAPKAVDADRSDDTGSVTTPGSKTAATAAKDIDLLVALVISRSDIKSVSALSGANIAIDAQESASESNIRSALVAAGASEVQLSVGGAKAIERLVGGEVPAAVVSLLSADAAEAFPDIAGFKVLRVPLSPQSLKAGLDKP